MIPILFRGPVTDGSGYSTNARNLLIQLFKSGKFHIEIENYLGSAVQADLSEEDKAAIISMKDNRVNRNEAVLIQVSVASQFIPDCKYNIGYSVFETNRVPFSWVLPSNKMDAICVPCSQNKAAFEDSGITSPVYVVPHGVSQRSLNNDLKPFNMFADKFNFLFLGTPQYRKGIDQAIYAYLSAFGDSDDTRLICKIYVESDKSTELAGVRGMIADARKKLGKNKGEIVIIPKYLNADKLIRLYKSAGALILPSRGEGWGFAGSEAAASGVPVIATGWGGPADYLNEDVAYLIDYEMTKVKNMQFNPQFLLAQMEGHEWAEPNVLHLIELMKEVYSNKEKSKAKGMLAAKHMADNFTWEKSGEKLIEVIENVVKNSELVQGN